MELFKMYGYDCMFGGVDYLGRLMLVTLVPLLILFILALPFLATFIFKQHRRSDVFDQFSNSAMWVVYVMLSQKSMPVSCLTVLSSCSCKS